MSGLPGPAAWQARYEYDGAASLWRPRAAHTQFGYTDGTDVEARLFEAVAHTADRSVLSMTLRRHITDWPSRYHLSPVRANLLRPIAARLTGASVLEVGAGCGAITRFLGESGATVVALEGSPTRARIAAARCSDLPGVSVIADVFQDLPVAPEFDFVSLIGVLEYARIFFPAGDFADPVDAMLAHAALFLKPDGCLIIAIENQLGLKYFAGSPEDHVSIPMYGIDDLYERHGVVTFGRQELARRLSDAGLDAQHWLYPFPDYKLPSSVLTEKGVGSFPPVDLAPMLSACVAADPQRPQHPAFSLERAWGVVFRNGLGGELANSFLVLARGTHGSSPPSLLDDSILAWHYSVDRKPCFAKALTIRAHDRDTIVTSTPVDPGVPASRESVGIQFGTGPFLEGELWQSRLLAILNSPGWTMADISSWTSSWLDCIAREAGLSRADLQTNTMLPGRMLDAVPRNLIRNGDTFRFFDLEWVARDGVRFGHLYFRGVVSSLLSVSSIARPASGEEDVDVARLHAIYGAVAKAVEVTATPEEFSKAHAEEFRFQEIANGNAWYSEQFLLTRALPMRDALRRAE